MRNRIAFNIESLLRLRAEKRIYYIHPTTSTECLLGSLMTEKAIFIDGLPVHRHQPNLNSSGEKITRRVIHQIEHVDTFPAPIVDTSFAKTRLEVLKAWEINFSIIFLHISSLLAFIYICSSSSRIISAWNVSKKIPEPSFLDASLESSLNALSTFVPIAFIFLVISDGNATQEQQYTGALLAIGIFFKNPLSYPHRHHRIGSIFNDAMYSSATFFYILLSVHSYRTFRVPRRQFRTTYAFKLVVMVIYLLIRLTTGCLMKVITSTVPLTSFLIWVILPPNDRQLDRVTASVLLISFMDIFFILWIVREVTLTRKFLSKQPYLDSRTKQLGFRCFVYQFTVFGICLSLFSAICVWFTPRELLRHGFLRGEPDTTLSLNLEVGNPGLYFIFVLWILNLAHVNLPANLNYWSDDGKIMKLLKRISESSFSSWLRKHKILAQVQRREVPEEGGLLCNNEHICPLRYQHREIVSQNQKMFNLEDEGPDEVKERFLEPLLENNNRKLKIFTDNKKEGYILDTDLNENDCFYPEYTLNVVGGSDQTIEIHGRAHDNSRDGNNSTGPIKEITTVRIPLLPNCKAGIEYLDKRKKRSRKVGTDGLMQTPGKSPEALLQNLAQDRIQIHKNVLVMETHVLLANISYLAYIPGNLNEEYVSSALDQKDDLDPNSFNRLISAEVLNDKPPKYDDGSSFLIDVAKVCEGQNLFVFRHISNEQSNTHAIILVGKGRVIVAFSGTRDSTNWATSSRFNRSVYDEKFPRFEYEEADAEQLKKTKTRAYERIVVNPRAHDDSFESQVQQRPNWEASGSSVRRSRSSDSVLVFPDLSSNDLEQPCDFENNLCYDHHLSKYGAVSKFELKPFRRRFRHRSFSSFETNRKEESQFYLQPIATSMANEILTFGQSKVHTGFADAYLGIRKQILGALVELYGGNHCKLMEKYTDTKVAEGLPVFFCGHSLGGALATFAAFDAAKYYRKIGIKSRQMISCSTFGCPMIGNDSFKKMYEETVKNHWRFEIASDPIPKLPSSFFNYMHVGTRVLMDQSGILLIDPSFVEMQWWGTFNNPYLRYKLHIRASYISALKSYCALYRGGKDDLRKSFWPFPIKAQTKGLFQALEDRHNSNPATSLFFNSPN